MSGVKHFIDLRPEGKTLCGRPPGWGRKTHRDWPTCKTCLRVADLGRWKRIDPIYDDDGWATTDREFTTGTYILRFAVTYDGGLAA